MTKVWVMVGITGALAVGSIVVGALAMERKGTYDDFAQGGDRKEAEEVRAQGEALNVTTDILLGATVISAGITAILFFTSGPDEPDAPSTAALRLAPAVGSHTGALLLEGTF